MPRALPGASVGGERRAAPKGAGALGWFLMVIGWFGGSLLPAGAEACFRSPGSLLPPWQDRAEVCFRPVIHSLGSLGRSTRLRLGERIERARHDAPTLHREIP